MGHNPWDTASTTVVRDSLLGSVFDRARDRDALLERYADYYDGRPAVLEKYFKKRHFETSERFADRPKLSWPICRPIANTHAEALAKNITIKIEHEATNEEWQEIAAANDIPAFLVKVATITSVFGSAGSKPLVHDDGTTDKQIEFHVDPPDAIRFLFESDSSGRSVKRPQAVVISSGYNVDNATSIPMTAGGDLPEKLRGEKTIRIKTELITPNRWLVWLDDEITPVSPFGERWMPRDDGTNPFSQIMPTLFNSIETYEDHFGISKLNQTVFDVQSVNEIWSDLVYMFRMYVPIIEFETDSPDSRKVFKAGIGAGIAHNTDEKVGYINANIDWKGVLEPLNLALQMTYSNSQVPAVAVGLGHTLGQQSVISGVAKEYEWKPTVGAAMMSRPPFTRAIKDMVRKALLIASTDAPGENGQRIGQGKNGLDLNSPITVEYSDEIIPTSEIETVDRLTKENVAGLKSAFSAMMELHGWDEQRASEEMDMIRAESQAGMVEHGFKAIVDAVRKRNAIDVTSGDVAAVEAEIFGATPGLGSDVTAVQGNRDPGAATDGN